MKYIALHYRKARNHVETYEIKGTGQRLTAFGTCWSEMRNVGKCPVTTRFKQGKTYVKQRQVDHIMKNIQITDLIEISLQAGKEILNVYDTDFSVETKDDESPLTLADQKSHDVITEGLSKLYPDIPILSEEGVSQSYETRKNWDWFWLVDPLDGTKEFVKRNGEFTTNIALIHEGRAVLGVIYAPVLETVYVGRQDVGAYKLDVSQQTDFTSDEQLMAKSEKLPIAGGNKNYTVIASRSHMSPETETYVKEQEQAHGDVDIISAGSSLKLCLVAEGKANVYPRFAPTMEWDTGAGQAIVEASGGTVTETETKNNLLYNKENLKNPWFIAKES